MKLNHVAATVAVLTLSSAAYAKPTYMKVLAGTYKIPAGSALAKAKCGACHVGTSARLNPYGKSLALAIKTMKARSLTPDVLKSVENLDSDKDKVRNIDEIKKGRLPGVPKK